MFSEAKNIAKYRRVNSNDVDALLSICMLPNIIIPDMALVTLINGECSIGVTCQIAKYPIKHDKIKISIKYIYYPL